MSCSGVIYSRYFTQICVVFFTQVFCCTMMTRVSRTFTSSTLSGCVTSWLASSPSGRSTVSLSQVWGAYHIKQCMIFTQCMILQQSNDNTCLSNSHKITSPICYLSLSQAISHNFIWLAHHLHQVPENVCVLQLYCIVLRRSTHLVGKCQFFYSNLSEKNSRSIFFVRFFKSVGQPSIATSFFTTPLSCLACVFHVCVFCCRHNENRRPKDPIQEHDLPSGGHQNIHHRPAQ